MRSSGPNKKHGTQQSVDQAVKSICDIMRRGNCAGAMQYVPELTWILFLRILDEIEGREAGELEAIGLPITPSLEAPYRWRDWASPGGAKRTELQERGDLKNWADGELIPFLKKLESRPGATSRQKVISEIMSGVERVRIDTQRNFLDVLDKVDELSHESVDPTHVFTLSQVYEGLLLKMGEKNNDGGQFFTPREVIRAMVRAVDPRAGETVYDPGCGTGGFLAQAFEHMRKAVGPLELEALKDRTFYGREKENLIYPIALANLVLHGIDRANIWHGNTLTGHETYGGLFEGAPSQFDVIMMNPPFGGKEGKEAQTNFDYKTGATQVLFLQHVIRSLKNGGRYGIVVDEGLLFRTNEDAFTRTKRKLLDDCDLWCVLSLPGGVFTAAGAGVKTNLLFFTKGKRTEKIWYYDLSEVKVRKKMPLTLKHFEEFLRLLPERAESGNSWTVNIRERLAQAHAQAEPLREQARGKDAAAAKARECLVALKKAKPRDEQAIAAQEVAAKWLAREGREIGNKADALIDAVYDLKAVNPHRKPEVDTRTPAELIAIIRDKGIEIECALAQLSAHLRLS